MADRTLCVIPVRGGSKGLPRKNLLELAPGLTLIDHAIGQAQAVYATDEVIVSTDDGEMAEVARRRETRVVMRPDELARDDSTTASVVDHLLETLGPDGMHYDTIVILQVTSPLREVEDIARGKEMMATGGFDSVVSAYADDGPHPAKTYLVEDGLARSVLPRFETARRQDLPPVFRRNGALFMVTRDHYAETGKLWGGRIGLVEMSRERSIDIDRSQDFELARARFMDRMQA
jgi:CMP-N,N'-diacetyllegionaminic acid synthase